MHGNLEKVYFPIPALMHYLSDETKQNFLEEVSRESINDKINGLLERIQDFYLEITYYQKLHQFGLRYNNTSLTYIRNLCLLIAFLINLLLLVN
jgi:inositol 1,4,5-triphosphate receptor type 3